MTDLQIEGRDLLYQSEAMKSLMSLLPQVAQSKAHVLIVGESGTGKELIAKKIHQLGPRADKPFVSINCAAVPHDILESEFFGYEKKSYAGSESSQKGIFQEANGGVLFLNEVGDMPLSLQAKFVSVLQEKSVRSMTGDTNLPIDIQVIAATHRNLQREILKGQFREDLYYHLNVMPLSVPPLRSRPEDIPFLIEGFSEIYSKRMGRKPPIFSSEVMQELSQRPWYGNLKEMENLMERLFILHGDKEIIEMEHLPSDESLCVQAESEFNFQGDFPTLSQITNQYIHYIYQQVNHHQGKAAEILGLSRRTLYRKLKTISSNNQHL